MIYDRIKQLCVTEGISISKLEQKLEFSNGSIGKWNKSSPTMDKLQKVASHFHVPLEYFLEDNE